MIATAAPTADARKRRATAEKLLDHLIEHAKVFAKVETLKDELREFSISGGIGFGEKFDGKGAVRVTKQSVRTFKGIVPTLKPEVFLDLSEARRDRLVADGLVDMVEKYTEDRKPSVSVDIE
jgi:hypothetical protein